MSNKFLKIIYYKKKVILFNHWQPDSLEFLIPHFYMKRLSFYNLNINTAFTRSCSYGARVMTELSPMQGKLTTSSPYSQMDTNITSHRLTIHRFLYFIIYSDGLQNSQILRIILTFINEMK